MHIFVATRNNTFFEISNHLGNVHLVLSDYRSITGDASDAITGYHSVVSSSSEYYPFGMVLVEGGYNSESYRYGFNTQEKDDEIYGSGNSYSALFWQYDARLGRRWNRDPKPNPSISQYATFSGNPIFFSDILGDTVRGTDERSATRMRDVIRGSFSGDEAKELRGLFNLADDGLTMQTINREEFENAIEELDTDQKSLAWGYFYAINSKPVHNVTMVNRNEEVDVEAWQSRYDIDPLTGESFEIGGGAAYYVFEANETYNLVVMDSQSSTTYVVNFGVGSVIDENGTHTPGQALAHELLGHSVPQMLESHEYAHRTPIQLSNLYRRANNYLGYRDGVDHGGPALNFLNANAIPYYIREVQNNPVSDIKLFNE